MSMIGRTMQHLAGRWARGRIKRRKPAHPLELLRYLLERAVDTRYGRQYGFGDMIRAADCYERFAERVPILDYEQWVAWLGDKSPLGEQGAHPLINEAWPGKIDMFCLSSGTTTGRTRYIPYSREMAAVNRRAALDFFAHAVRVRPGLAPPVGRTLYMSGSTHLRRNPQDALCGDMSGLTKYLAPPMMDAVTLPSRRISSIQNWDERLNALVDLCLKRPDIAVISGIPIWQLTLLEHICQKSGKPLRRAMPGLQCIIHGGMSLEPYRERLADMMGPDAMFLETYAASETGIAAFGLPGEQGMRFQEDYGVFYEFEAPDGRILLGAEVKPGVPYALIVSSCSGLWRYKIGDLLSFKSINPLVLDYVTRDKTTSAFDEKMTEKETERAMSAMNPSFGDFSMGPDTIGRRHCWFLVGRELPDEAWLTRLDNFLREHNEDYDDYRGDGRINKPIMILVNDRAAYLERLGRVEGGQRKYPRLLSDAEVKLLLKSYQEVGS